MGGRANWNIHGCRMSADIFRLQKHLSGSVLISKKGEVVFKQSCGYADHEQEIEHSPQSLFSTASLVAKPMTALSILQLIEQGELSLEQPVEDFFHAFMGKGITIEHLLNHTSGIPNFLFLKKELPWEEEHSAEHIIDFTARKPLQFQPGRKFAYNNTGFLMLALIVEQVTGLTYHQYVKQNILEPAGMESTTFHQIGKREIHVNGYIQGKPGPYISPVKLLGCGDTITTVDDLHSFDQALRTCRLAKPETIQLMETESFSNRIVNLGRPWLIKHLFHGKSVSNGGFHPEGYAAHMERYLDDEMTIIVLINDLRKFSALSMKEFCASWISRELSSIIYGKKLPFWQKVI